MKKFLSCILLAAMLLGLSVPVSAVPKSDNMQSVFESDSYWIMSQTSVDGATGKTVETVTHYVRLETIFGGADIINVDGDDLDMATHYDWNYDETENVLEISKLKDGWNAGEFRYRNGAWVSPGAYYDTILRTSPDARKKFETTYAGFQQKYGLYNPAKRLTASNGMDRYRPLSDWERMDYDTFRYVAMQRSFGIVGPEDADILKQLQKEFGRVFRMSDVRNFNADRVLFGIDLPEEDTGVLYYDADVNVINLVYTDPMKQGSSPGTGKAYSTFMKADIGKLLRKGVAEKHNRNIADHWACSFVWNDEEAVAMVCFDTNIVIFRGPTIDVRQMTEYLNLDFDLWELP